MSTPSGTSSPQAAGAEHPPTPPSEALTATQPMISRQTTLEAHEFSTPLSPPATASGGANNNTASTGGAQTASKKDRLRPGPITIPPASESQTKRPTRGRPTERDDVQRRRPSAAGPPTGTGLSSSTQYQQRQQPHQSPQPSSSQAPRGRDGGDGAKRIWPFRKTDALDHATRDAQETDLDDINRPGLRVSALFVITFIASSLLLTTFWQIVGGTFSDARVRSEAVGNSNVVATASTQWSSLVGEVQERLSMPISLFTNADVSIRIVPLMCSVGQLRISGTYSVPIRVGNESSQPLICADSNMLTGTIVRNNTYVYPFNSTESREAGERVAHAFDVWREDNVTHSTISSEFDLTLVAGCADDCFNSDTRDLSQRPPLSPRLSVLDRLTYYPENFRRDLQAAYPLINMIDAPTRESVAESVREASSRDPSLFAVRIVENTDFEDADDIMLAIIRGETVQLVGVSRQEAFRYLFGYQATRRDSNSVSQPFRFSAATLLVENNVPTARLSRFRAAISSVAAQAGITPRPFINRNFSALFSTTTSGSAALREDQRSSLAANFRASCAGDFRSSAYGDVLDYPFSLVTLSNNASRVVRHLPDASPVTPELALRLRTPDFEDQPIILCAQFCQSVSAESTEQVHLAELLPDTTGAAELLPQTNQPNTTSSPTGFANSINVPSYCEKDAGQRVFFMTLATDSDSLVRNINTVLEVVGWVSIIANLILHTILYGVVAVPIRYLRTRVLCTLQSRPMRFAIARHLVIRLTRRFWVGEIRSLTNAYAAMMLKYEQSRKFVPDYVRRRQQATNLRALMAEAERLETEQLTAQQPSAEELARTQRREMRERRDRRPDAAAKRAEDDLLAAATALEHRESGATQQQQSQQQQQQPPSVAADGPGVTERATPAPSSMRGHPGSVQVLGEDLSPERYGAVNLGQPVIEPMDPSGRRGTLRGAAGSGVSLPPPLHFDPHGGGGDRSALSTPDSPAGAAPPRGHSPSRIPKPKLSQRQQNAQRPQALEPPSPLVAGGGGFAVPMPGDNGGFNSTVGGGGGGGMNNNYHRASTMTLVESASVVVVSLTFLENAYMENFVAAETVHLKVIATLLEIFRRHGGEPFGRDNLIGGASWNTFEPDALHIHAALGCAFDLVRTFAQLRLRGVKMGFSVNTGPLVVGVTGDAQSVTNCILGESLTFAIKLAELCKDLRGVTMLTTQPVRQALSIFHEFLLVDIIQVVDYDNTGIDVAPIAVFDVRPGDELALQMPSDDPNGPGGSSSPLNSFASEYNTAFTHFRTHEFKQAIDVLKGMIRREEDRIENSPGQLQVALARRNDAAVVRLMQLCHYFIRHPDALPKPYRRTLPRWSIPEAAIDQDDGVLSSSMLMSTTVNNDSATFPATAQTMNEDGDAAGFDRPPGTATLPTPRGGRKGPPVVVGSSALVPAPSSVRIFGNRGQDDETFRTQLANAMAQGSTKRGHRRTDSGHSVKTSKAGPTPAPHSDSFAASGNPAPGRAGLAQPSPYAAATPHDSAGLTNDRLTYEGSDMVKQSSSGDHRNATNDRDTRSPQEMPLVMVDDLDGDGDSSLHHDGADRHSATPHLRPGTGGETDKGSTASRRDVAASPNKTDSTNGSHQPARIVRHPGDPIAGGIVAAANPLRKGPLASAQAAYADAQSRLGETIEFADASFRGGGIAESLLRWKPKQAGGRRATQLEGTLQTDTFIGDGDPHRADHAPGAADSAQASPKVISKESAAAAAAFQQALITEYSLTDEPRQGVNDSMRPPDAAGGFRSPNGGGGGGQPKLRPNDDSQEDELSGSLGCSMTIRPTAPPTSFKASNGSWYQRSERIIGKGSFGTVYLGMETHSSLLVALKVLPLPKQDPTSVRQIENEVNIMQRVRDSHVVDFLGYAFHQSIIILVMECVIAGSLQSMLSSFQSLNTATTVNFIRDILRGLSRLHSEGIMHRDVKPQNVLITTSGKCKLTDFGASAMLNALARGESAAIEGTPLYLSPEAARGHATYKSDIWAVGIMFLQLITGQVPYVLPDTDIDATVFVYQVGSGDLRPRYDSGALSSPVRTFVEACLEPDPEKRRSANQVLELPFFFV